MCTSCQPSRRFCLTTHALRMNLFLRCRPLDCLSDPPCLLPMETPGGRRLGFGYCTTEAAPGSGIRLDTQFNPLRRPPFLDIVRPPSVLHSLTALGR